MSKNPEDMTPIEAKSALGGNGCCTAMQPGWVVASFHDPSERRGLWFRETRVDTHDADCTRIGLTGAPFAFLGCCNGYRRVTKLEICAGREGDDTYVELTDRMTLDGRTLSLLADALGRAAGCVADAGVVDENGRIKAWGAERTETLSVADAVEKCIAIASEEVTACDHYFGFGEERMRALIPGK